jgi:hypothetical protein
MFRLDRNQCGRDVREVLKLNCARLLRVMSYGGHWGAPLMLAALAGVIHDCQCADGQEHNRSDDNCYGGLHRHLPTANLPGKFSR